MSSEPDVAVNQESLRYKDAGVDIDAGNALIDAIRPISKRSRRPEVLSGLGGFGALCEIPGGYSEPVLVAATDGVGTKLKLAMELGRHDTIGIDLVAMCVNDLILCGAEPLFFLDYYATGGLNVETATEVVRGIGRGCELAGCALVGGETAEMPGMYQGEDYDVAGFAVGVVEKARIIDQSQVKAGDVLIGIDSSGPHSNGYSLIRKILERSGASLADEFEGSSLGATLLTPTLIYVKAVQALLEKVDLHGMAHITGGGITENLPRVLPEAAMAKIDTHSWTTPAIFNWLQEQGRLEDAEMYRTFNCGIGLIVCIHSAEVNVALDILRQQGLGARVIGEVLENSGHGEPVQLI